MTEKKGDAMTLKPPFLFIHRYGNPDFSPLQHRMAEEFKGGFNNGIVWLHLNVEKHQDTGICNTGHTYILQEYRPDQVRKKIRKCLSQN